MQELGGWLGKTTRFIRECAPSAIVFSVKLSPFTISLPVPITLKTSQPFLPPSIYPHPFSFNTPPLMSCLVRFGTAPLSYTHLTRLTTYSVCISVGPVELMHQICYTTEAT